MVRSTRSGGKITSRAASVKQAGPTHAGHPTVSCIIPAYNEAPRIASVLSTVMNHPLVSEIVVINDGSTDATLAIVQSTIDRLTGSRSDVSKNVHDSLKAPSISHYRSQSRKSSQTITLITYPNNKGKSYAMYRGIKAATGDFLLFLDSDLQGLGPQHITQLIEPVISGQADLSISLRQNSPLFWRMIGLDYISGERVFARSLLSSADELLSLPGFGLEVFLNERIIARRLRIKVVRWAVDSPFPTDKYGFSVGIGRFFGMLKQIFRTVGIARVCVQIVRMSRQKV